MSTYSHVWASPVSDPCPDCECCTEALCQRAIIRGSACHLEARGGEELTRCPCWRNSTKEFGRRLCELVEQGMDPLGAHLVATREQAEALVARLREERDRLARELIKVKREEADDGAA